MSEDGDPKAGTDASLAVRDPAVPSSLAIPLWRKLVYAVLVWLVFAVTLEGVLAIVGVEPLSAGLDPFAGFSQRHRVFRPDPERGVYRNVEAGLYHSFNPQQFALEKPENGFRVFALGGSSTYGFPWGARVAFPRILGDGLQRAWPERQVESVNVGGMSYASHRMRILVHELLDYQTDLLIVYGGHNEFVETRFYRHLLERNQWLDPVRAVLALSRFYGFLTRTLRPQAADESDSESASLGEMLGMDVRRQPLGRVTPEERALTLARYEENLRAVVELATARGVDVLLSTVPSNLAGFPPIQSAHGRDLDVATREEIETTLAAFKERFERGETDALRIELEALVARAEEHASLHYSLGRVYEALHRVDEARAAFVRARDLDAMPARASSAFNEVVRRVAAETDAHLVDAEAAMTRAATDGMVGFGLIEDYVHPTPEGHWQIAAEMWTTLKAAGLLTESAPDFRTAAGPPLDRDAALPDDPLLRSRFLYNLALVLQQLGENERSAEKYRACLRSNPRYVACEYNLAILHQNAGDLDAAVSGFRRVVVLQPDNPTWMYQLGYALLERGEPKAAEAWLRRAAEGAPEMARYWSTLGRAYALLGKSGDAERAHERARALEKRRFDEP